jgi:ankyrin repeat protein
MDLLHKNGAVMDVEGESRKISLHMASLHGSVDILQWLLNHGADVNAWQADDCTPLHLAAFYSRPESVQMLLEHNTDVNLQNDDDTTPLCEALYNYCSSRDGQGHIVNIVQQLLEHGADTNIPDPKYISTLLYLASSEGWLEIARLLLSHRAIVDERGKDGRTPFQGASKNGHQELAEPLLEHGAAPQL